MNNENGFTFTELLLVTVMLGILTGMAITQYRFYKVNSYNAAASADMRNAMTAIEVYEQDNNAYPSCSPVTCPSVLPGFNLTPSVNITFISDALLSVTGVSCHMKGDTRYIFTGIPGLIVSSRTGGCGV